MAFLPGSSLLFFAILTQESEGRGTTQLQDQILEEAISVQLRDHCRRLSHSDLHLINALLLVLSCFVEPS